MSELEERIGQVLSNPQMMQQIMSLAQSMGAQQQKDVPPEPAPAQPSLDPGMLRKVASLAGSTGVDQNQKALLKALGPYISRERVSRLERAMQAARMAALASSMLSGR